MSDNDQVITQKTCTRCGATWFPRSPGRPVACAKCHSPYWDKPRVYKLRNRKPARYRGDLPQDDPAPTADNQDGGDPDQTAERPRTDRAGEALETYRRIKAAERESNKGKRGIGPK